MLHAQAKTLLALDRPETAEPLLLRLINMGSRGLFAPDILVPSWVLVGQSREALGDLDGAREAYQNVLTRWGNGEGTPATSRARAALDRLKQGS